MPMSETALLVQPPMVEEGADVIYPSLPVLGAALAKVGIKTKYQNLNLAYIVHEKTACLNACRNLSPDRFFSRKEQLGLSVEEDRFNFWAASFVSFAKELGNRLKVTPNGHVRVDSYIDCESFFSCVWKDFAAQLSPQLLIDQNSRKILKIDGGDRFTRFLDLNKDLWLSSNWLFVAITTPMADNIGYSLSLSKWLKSLSPRTKVILGGTAFSAIAPWLLEEIRNLPYIDHVIEGPGENALIQLAIDNTVQIAFSRKPFAANHGGKVELLSRRPAVRGKLQNAPGVTYPRPADTDDLNGEVTLLQSRGCYWGECVYCTYPELYGPNNYFERDVETVIDEMERHVAMGYKRFRLANDTLRIGYAAELAEAIIDRGLDIKWRSFMRAEPFSSEILQLMKNSGGTGFIIGLETIVDRLLMLVKKGVKRRTIEQLFENLEEIGLMVEVNVIPDLPTCTVEESLETLHFLERFKGIISRLNVSSLVVPLRSPMSESPEAFGLRLKHHNPRNALQSTLLPFERIRGATLDELAPINRRLLNLSSEIRRAETVRATSRLSAERISAPTSLENRFSWVAPLKIVVSNFDDRWSGNRFVNVVYDLELGRFYSEDVDFQEDLLPSFAPNLEAM